jgi:hypothetical protein
MRRIHMKPKEKVNYITKLHCPINSVLSYSETFKRPLIQSGDNDVYYTIKITMGPIAVFKTLAEYNIIIETGKRLEIFNGYKISGRSDDVQSMFNDINNALDEIECAIEPYIEAKRTFDDTVEKIKTEIINWKVEE